MAELIAKQLQLRRLIERSLDNFKKIGKQNLTPAKVRSRIASLKDNWTCLLNGHAALLKAIPEPSQSSMEYFVSNVFDSTSDVYQSTLDYMTESLEELEPPVSPSANLSADHSFHTANSFSLSHLPHIHLPPFSGDYSEWEQFRDRFTSLIINNKELGGFAKMHFLNSCLKGRALECVTKIPVTAENFNVAWRALTSRFENKRRLLNHHLSTLLNLPLISRESASDLQGLRDRVDLIVASLENLGRSPSELWYDLLVHVIAQKVDPTTRKAWTMKSSDGDEPPSFEELCHFLEIRIRALEEFSAPSLFKPCPKSAAPSKINAATASAQSIHTAATSAKPATSCPMCKARHYFSVCPSFVSGSPSQRRDLAKRHRRCFNCLSANHSAGECKSKYSCRHCNLKHHTLLHASSTLELPVPDQSISRQTTPSPAPDLAVNSMLASVLLRSPSTVLLATAWITVSTSSGRSVVVRALLDQGSEMTFITEGLAQILRAKRIKMPVSISAIGGVPAGTARFATPITVSPRAARSPVFTTTALILRTLTAYVPPRTAKGLSLPHLMNLQWADSNPTSSDPISIILGADIYSDILLEGLRKGRVGEPIGQNTIFGWVISGPTRPEGSDPSSPAVGVAESEVHLSVHHCLNSPSIEEAIKKFWELEEVPRKPVQTREEEQCEEHFKTHHSRCDDGRYIVRLPFRRGPPIEIGHSRGRAEKSLNSLTRRLSVNSEHFEAYRDFIEQYEKLGHMRKAPVSSLPSAQNVYIPHHPVFREASATTRLRVVFNASSVTSNGSSLNDNLYAGPKLQLELSAIILRWRQYQYVYTTDIEKMFRQIRLDPRDCDYQRILWRTAPTETPTEYQLQTVTYGMACAPFLALRTIQQLASDEAAFPLASAVLRNNIYVDDVLFGGEDEESLRDVRDQLIELLRRGGFELRKWASNSSSLLSDIDTANHGLACNKSLSDDDNLKVLGVEWNPARDGFRVTVSLAKRPPASKRSILSAIARLYDPLGWITPVTITAKIFLQQLWKAKLDWDVTLPPGLLERWQIIYSRWSFLNELQLDRWTGFSSNILRAELHGFADASNHAYAAVTYLKIVPHSGDAIITLLAGKSKVAPLTPLTVPRLELSAAVLLARLIAFVRDSCKLANIPCFCWTDSMIVLAWLRQHPSKWKTFVAHRVAEVQTRLPQSEWRYVPTEDNPADCASRGLLGDELLRRSLWWQGPSWLRLSEPQWPASSFHLPTGAPLEAKTVVLHSTQPPEPFALASRFSTWPKLIRVTTYMFRFIARCRRKKSAQPILSTGLALTAAECLVSRKFWLKYIQAERFPSELLTLARGHDLSPKSSLLALRPFLAEDGLIRVGGRISRAPIPFNVRHPVLLTSHPLVSLIIDHAHHRALHSGLQLTLNTLRAEFWILRSRTLVKARLHRCVVCTRERAAVPSQIMSDLPAVRVTPPARSFLHCGLDYAGPVYVRAVPGRGSRSRKAYIALFICLATRAIHLELVGDCSTPAFLNAYVRFCSRRGLPQAMYTDNGTQFVGADRELAKAYRATIRDPDFQNRTAMDSVSWHFLPPSAPHFGGLWEAGVKSVKHHLRRVLGCHTLTTEEFTTLLCKIEACLNSRPIAPLSDTLDDYETLTPGHFLIGSALSVAPEPSLLSLKENRLSRWQLLRQIAERFWKLWQTDYVNTLQQRGKWRRERPPIAPGQLVLLRNSSLPPCKWETGRVTQCHPGLDGFTRVVTVKTATSEYRRPIVKLCVLPITCAESSS